jgi:photosystem II stability/assembly factor-like uncharacterized protein
MAKTVTVSTDGGESWTQRAALPHEEGYAFVIVPFSASVAWRWDVDHTFRTDDGGDHWTQVLPHAKGPSGPGLAQAVDADTAVFAEDSGAFWVTVDGGDTWTEQRFPK